jgi:hypothetical protein
MRKNAIALITCIIAIVIIVFVFSGPKPAPFKVGEEGLLPTLKIGDQWVYKVTPTKFPSYTKTVTIIGEEDINGKDCYVLEIVYEPPLGRVGRVKMWLDKTVWDPTWAELKMVSYVDNEDNEIVGPILINEYPEGYPFPLEPGKEYKIVQRWENENYSSTTSVKIEGIENVSVPAGTFRCFKITYFHEKTEITTSTWYSDTAKFEVKRVGEFAVWELMSYSIQQL